MRRLLLPAGLFPAALAAQAIDYTKADLIRTSSTFVLNTAVAPVWFQDSTRFYYRSATSSGLASWYVIDPVKLTKTLLFDNTRLAYARQLATATIINAMPYPTSPLTY